MKKAAVVWMAAAKNLWWKLLLVLTGLIGVETLLFWTVLERYQAGNGNEYAVISFLDLSREASLLWVFFTALVLLTVACCLQGCRFSGKNRYFLQRLPLAEWQITALWAMLHLACYLILWAVQTAGIFLLWKMYVAVFGSGAPGLELLTAVYENNFLHTMLPMADTTRWVLLAAYWLTMAVLTAAFGFFQRRGSFRIVLLLMLGCYFVITLEMGNAANDLLFSVGFVCLMGWNIYRILGVRHEPEGN